MINDHHNKQAQETLTTVEYLTKQKYRSD